MYNLYAPENLVVNFKPSQRQYKLWQLLQPNMCPHCGGPIEQAPVGKDHIGNIRYKPQCTKCKSFDLPQLILGGGAAGGGKALLPTAEILTPNGYVPLMFLTEGSVITDPVTGGAQSIVRVHPKERHRYYRVWFDDGTYTDCSEGHLWATIHKSETSQELLILSASELAGVYRSEEYYIPLTAPVIFNPREELQLVSSYELGVFCGKYSAVLPKKAHGYLNTRECVTDDGRISGLPGELKYGSIESRKDFMRGLTLHHSDNGTATFKFQVRTRRLSEDIAHIARSLGHKATASNDGVEISLTERGGKDAVAGMSAAKYAEPMKAVTYIDDIGYKEGLCITVSEPHGLYVTDGFTVTHNSYLGSCWVLSSCLRFPNIRAVVARKTVKILKESTFNTIKTILRQWGLREGAHYKINNVEGTITFWNDSVILLKDMVDLPSDPNFDRFGSSEFTIAFVDEVSEISERAIEVLYSRLRWRIHETFKTPRMLMTTNPCMTWVRSRFVQDDDGNPVTCKEGEAYVPFTLFDNPDENFRKIYESSLNKITDKATRSRLLYGNWDFIASSDAIAYWGFDGSRHLKEELFEKKYNALQPIVVSFDFNVAPYMSALFIQVDYENKKFYVLREVAGLPQNKENNTSAFASRINTILLGMQHVGGVIITGDPAGLAQSAITGSGVNNYTIIEANISPALHASRKMLSKQPPQSTRLNFINGLLGGQGGWEIQIDVRCRHLTEDFIYQRMNQDGTKEKKRRMDEKLGIKCEKYGHMSDCFDYAVCLLLSAEWKLYQRNGSSTVITADTPAKYNEFEY